MKPEQMDFFGSVNSHQHSLQKGDLTVKAARFLDVKVLSAKKDPKSGETHFFAKTNKEKLRALLQLMAKVK